MERTAEHIKEDRELLASSCPKLYNDYVQRDKILESARQIELAQMDEDEFFDYLMNRNTSDHLQIYPEHASFVMRCFSEGIFSHLRSLEDIKEEDLPRLREELGDKAKMIALSDWGDLYTQVPREEGAVMQTGELEYKVAKAIPVDRGFFATKTKGYYGFLKFYEEGVGKIALPNANAYLLGTGWLVSVKGGRAPSPIIAGEYKDVGLKDDIYQVVPIKFFNVEADRTKKYTTKSEVKERDSEGNPRLIVTKVVPRD